MIVVRQAEHNAINSGYRGGKRMWLPIKTKRQTDGEQKGIHC